MCRRGPCLPRKVGRRPRKMKVDVKCGATPATRIEGMSRQVPHLPRKTKVDVTQCHACHTKRRYVSPSATPATQSWTASPATKPAQACTSAPSEPAQCHNCHTCHAKQRWMSRKTTPATQNEGPCRQLLCRQVPRLPRKVGRRHCRPSAPKRTQARHQSQPSAISAKPATQNEGGCHQVPRLCVTKCHACHAKLDGVTSDQARLSAPKRAQARPRAPPEPAQCHKRHACQAKRRQMSRNTTPARQNEGGCHQAPGLPRKTKVDVTKCHACHTKRRYVSPSARPETLHEGR